MKAGEILPGGVVIKLPMGEAVELSPGRLAELLSREARGIALREGIERTIAEIDGAARFFGGGPFAAAVLGKLRALVNESPAPRVPLPPLVCSACGKPCELRGGRSAGGVPAPIVSACCRAEARDGGAVHVACAQGQHATCPGYKCHCTCHTATAGLGRDVGIDMAAGPDRTVVTHIPEGMELRGDGKPLQVGDEIRPDVKLSMVPAKPGGTP